MELEDVPPYTCSPTDVPVDGDVAFFDQDGNYLTAMVATACTADWFCYWLIYINFFPGVTALTWRNYAEYLAESMAPAAPDPAPEPAPSAP